MKKVSINQHVSYSQIIQGFYRADKWNMSKQELNTFIHQLVENGITTMDHADIYGHYTVEKMFGDALNLSPELKSQIEIVTKCGIVQPNAIFPDQTEHRYDVSKKHIKRSVERSLNNLQVDVIDTLLIHRPSPLMKPCEITEALQELVEEGKVKSFGVSNFRRSQYELLNECLKDDRFHIAVNQVEISPYHLDAFHDGTIDDMYKDQVKVMAWGPFAGGRLFDSSDKVAKRVLPVLKQIASSHQTSVEAVVIAWFMKHPASILPILGTQHMNRVQQAMKGLEIRLSDQEWFDIYTAAQGYDIP
ncbi:aldo/keto reductase [Staphylococcus chromogenes]|uniref:aldo/keto reductase n=1 Tax=Staphylococcus chromogenes TaxID=46126 RepID=UPI002DB7A3D1|nr:aldo/keto reductase [Staphylococcus chromogenes]MEB7824379.1 aldo/keto reductase [Staphylococcus chromogenes]